MRKLSVHSILAIALYALGCGATRRDFSVCDSTHSCPNPYTCDLYHGLCVLSDGPVEAPIVVPPTDAPAEPDLPTADGGGAIDLQGQTGDTQLPVDLAQADSQAPTDSLLIDRPADIAPDSPGTCSSDDQCSGLGTTPYCVGSMCVGCNAAGVDGGGHACPATTPMCNSITGRCVACLQNSDCPLGAKGFCSAQNQCVGCDDPGATSASSTGSIDAGGATDASIDATSPACNASVPFCVPSASASPKAGQCVGCLSSADCSGSTPICDTTLTFTCGACTSDKECAAKKSGPGICMLHQDGRCASDAETIYVQNTTGQANSSCITSGTSSASAPFCQPQAGINAALATGKSLVVLIGSSSTAGVFSSVPSLVASASQLSIIGSQSPIIAPGASDIGIHIVAGNVYLRGLEVEGGGSGAAVPPNNPGIVVEAGVTVVLDRVYVTGAAGGLWVKSGAGFDIANSIFALNLPGTGDYGVFSGVSLGSAGAGLPSRFWFNTVVNNEQIGVSCKNNLQPLVGVLIDGNTGDTVSECAVDNATSVTNANDIDPPGLTSTNTSTATSPYHLTVSSPCASFIPATDSHPPDDFDGDPRPATAGGKISCGAIQYPY